MKSAIFLAAAVALCGSAFAGTGQKIVNTAKQDAHQIGSSFRHDLHTIEQAPKFRQQEAAEQHRAGPETRRMGAGPVHHGMSYSRQERMDSAYANWQRSHR